MGIYDRRPETVLEKLGGRPTINESLQSNESCSQETTEDCRSRRTAIVKETVAGAVDTDFRLGSA